MSSRTHQSFRPRLDALESRTVPSVVPPNALVLGASAGSDPFVVVINTNTNQEVFRFMPFEQSFRGGVSVAVGDLVGDETPDIVVAAASQGGPRVAIYDGATGQVAKDFFVFEPTFTGGVSVAVGDVNGDGANDLVVGAGTGGGPRVVALDVETGNTLHDFFAFEHTFRGGVNVSAGDVNGDGRADLIIGAALGGAPRVMAFDGTDTGNILLNFFAYDSKFRDGVNVSAADVTGDGVADLLIGTGTGGAPHVRVIAGADGAEVMNFFAFDHNLRGGAKVAAVDTTGDGTADTLVVGTPGHLRRFFREVDGSTIAEDVQILDMPGGVFLSGFPGKGKGLAPGQGKGPPSQHPVFGNNFVRPHTTAGVISAVNPDLGTVTIQTGPTDTLAVYTIDATTRLWRDGEAVDDLTAFEAGDVAVLHAGPRGKVTDLAAVSSADVEAIAPPATARIEGVFVSADVDAGTFVVLTRSGTAYLIETSADTKFERNTTKNATLADLLAGDYVEARITGGVATKVEARGSTTA
jgi:hypothetical protein